LFLGESIAKRHLTRRVLGGAVPQGRNDWQPHKKSMPLGRLAVLVAGMPSWLAMMIDKDEFDLNPPGGSSGNFPTNFRNDRRPRADPRERGIGRARPHSEDE
jgi:hypothetical protein